MRLRENNCSDTGPIPDVVVILAAFCNKVDRFINGFDRQEIVVI